MTTKEMTEDEALRNLAEALKAEDKRYENALKQIDREERIMKMIALLVFPLFFIIAWLVTK